MEEKYCQSCGMPMSAPNAEYGTNAGGSRNEDYCIYCFENGKFTKNCTMKEMIEFCVPHMASAITGMSEGEARKMMFEFFPTLKRWKEN